MSNYNISLTDKKLILKNNEEVIYEYQYSEESDLILNPIIMEFGVKYTGIYDEYEIPFIIWECLGNIYFLHCDDDYWHNFIVYNITTKNKIIICPQYKGGCEIEHLYVFKTKPIIISRGYICGQIMSFSIHSIENGIENDDEKGSYFSRCIKINEMISGKCLDISSEFLIEVHDEEIIFNYTIPEKYLDNSIYRYVNNENKNINVEGLYQIKTNEYGKNVYVIPKNKISEDKVKEIDDFITYCQKYDLTLKAVENLFKYKNNVFIYHFKDNESFSKINKENIKEFEIRGLYTNNDYTYHSYFYFGHEFDENFAKNFANSCCSGKFVNENSYISKDILPNGIGIKMKLTTYENVTYELIIKIKLIEKEENKLFFDSELCHPDITTNVY